MSPGNLVLIPIVVPVFNWSNKLVGELDNVVHRIAKVFEEGFAHTYATWANKPDFQLELKLGPDRWEAHYFTTDKIYNIVSKGSPPHPIRARRAPRLVFRVGGFAPKTTPGALVSRPGSPASGPVVTPFEVSHPGHEGRKFDETVVKQSKDVFYRWVQEAFDRALT